MPCRSFDALAEGANRGGVGEGMGAEIVWGGGAGEWRKKWEGDSKRENEWRL
jgi:hypothetical protein